MMSTDEQLAVELDDYAFKATLLGQTYPAGPDRNAATNFGQMFRRAAAALRAAHEREQEANQIASNGLDEIRRLTARITDMAGHEPGCPAAGGYGHGKEPCICAAGPAGLARDDE